MKVLRVACALPLALTGCLKSPPVMHPTSVAAPTVPSLPVEPDSATFGWLRTHQTVRMLERVGAGELAASARKSGVDLSQIDPEAASVVVMGDPNGGSWQKTPVAAFIPVSPQSSIAQLLGIASAAVGGTVMPFDSGTAVTINRPPLDDTNGAGQLRALAAAPLSIDTELLVHLGALRARYAAEVDRGMEELRKELAKPKPGVAPLPPAFVDAYVHGIRSFIDAMKSLTIGFGAREDGIDIFAVSREKAGAPPAASSEDMPNLAQFVPAGELRMEVGDAGYGRLRDFALGFYDAALKDQPALNSRMKAVIDAWQAGHPQTAASVQLDPEHLLSITAVIESTETARQLEAMHQGFALLKEEPVRKLLGTPGATLETSSERGVRKIEGWPVDHLRYSVKLDVSKVPAQTAAVLERLWKHPFEIEVVRVGNYLVYTMNRPAAELDAVVHELLAGKGSGPALAARRLAAGAGFYVDVDVPGLMNAINQFLPEGKRDIPVIDRTIPPVTLLGYQQVGVGYYRAAVPRRLVDALRAIASKK